MSKHSSVAAAAASLPPIEVPAGAGNPMRTSLNTLLTGSTEQNHLNNQMGGAFHQPHSAGVIVPTLGTQPNPTHTALAEILLEQRANAEYDTQHGGRRPIMKRLELLRRKKTQKRNKRKKTQKRNKRKKTQKRNKRKTNKKK